MPIVLESEHSSMKLNGYDNCKQLTDREQYTNGTNDTPNLLSGVLVDDILKCSLCEVTFNTLGDFEAHSSSLDHAQKVLQHNLNSLSSDTIPLKNQSEETCVYKIDKDEQQEKDTSKTNIVVLENTKFKLPGSPYSCSHCIMKFNGPDPYKQHLESRSHKKKVLLKENSFDKIKEIDGHMFCDVCKKYFSGEKLYNEHLMSKKHLVVERHLQLLKENTVEDTAPKAKKIKIDCMSEEGKQFFCKICNVPCSGVIPYSQHVVGNTHKKNVARQARASIDEPSINQPNSLLGDKNYSDHVNNAARSSSDPAFSENMKNSVELSNENTDEDSAPKAKKIKIDITSEEWFCKICTVQCSGLLPYSQHIDGKSHKKNVARSQAGVNIEKSINQLDPFLPNNNNIDNVNTADKNVSDPACSKNLSDVSPTLTIIKTEGERNKKEIDESKPAWFCEVCNVHCTGPFDFSEHRGGKSHKRKFDLYQKKNYSNEPKVSIDFHGAKSDANNFAQESNGCSLEQNMCPENIDSERDLRESVKIFSLDEEINFD